MGKVIVLILIALGANVNAKEMVADILVDRASHDIVGAVFVDMDDSVLAKAAGQTSQQQLDLPKARVAPARPKGGATFFAPKEAKSKRIFGGTNSRNAPGVSGKTAVMKTKESQGLYGGGPNIKRFGGLPAAEVPRPKFVLPKLKPLPGQTKGPAPKRVFGGTNSRNAPGVSGKTAVLRGKAVGLYAPPKR